MKRQRELEEEFFKKPLRKPEKKKWDFYSLIQKCSVDEETKNILENFIIQCTPFTGSWKIVESRTGTHMFIFRALEGMKRHESLVLCALFEKYEMAPMRVCFGESSLYGVGFTTYDLLLQNNSIKVLDKWLSDLSSAAQEELAVVADFFQMHHYEGKVYYYDRDHFAFYIENMNQSTANEMVSVFAEKEIALQKFNFFESNHQNRDQGYVIILPKNQLDKIEDWKQQNTVAPL